MFEIRAHLADEAPVGLLRSGKAFICVVPHVDRSGRALNHVGSSGANNHRKFDASPQVGGHQPLAK